MGIAAASLVEDPSRLKCWHRLGTALFNTGDHALALDACLRGLALKSRTTRRLRALELKASAAKPADDAAAAASAAARTRSGGAARSGRRWIHRRVRA